MTRPNFFIVGAPKCGTTSLITYLNFHPEVFVPEETGLYFFCEDFPALRTITSVDDYTRRFAEQRGDCRAYGESSAIYIYSRPGLQRMRAFNPAARLIIMLRRPLEMIHSFHGQLLYDLDEDEPDFQRAWRLQEARRNGAHLPPHCRHPRLLQYADIGKLGKYVGQVLEIFPRDQVHFIFFEEFTTRTDQVYQETLSFLGLRSYSLPDYPPQNVSKRHASRVISTLTRRPPPLLLSAADRLKRLLRIRRLHILDFLNWLNVRKQQRDELPEAFRRELLAEFRSDIQLTAQLTGRDLAHWLQV